ncbi:hypothetical protein F4604DRAFT_1918053 [Suillus subluteus]|nr:hypothetical protein F4604DRAFT_1918053 [Suillus subluteus]
MQGDAETPNDWNDRGQSLAPLCAEHTKKASTEKQPTSRVVSIVKRNWRALYDALRARQSNIEAGVHIADVSHFVHLETAMDSEAAARGSTVCLVDKCIDMLPSLLGTNLCSLRRHHVERLAFSVIWASLIVHIRQPDFLVCDTTAQTVLPRSGDTTHKDFPTGHYILPDTNVSLAQMDLIESNYFTPPTIIRQTVMEERKVWVFCNDSEFRPAGREPFMNASIGEPQHQQATIGRVWEKSAQRNSFIHFTPLPSSSSSSNTTTINAWPQQHEREPKELDALGRRPLVNVRVVQRNVVYVVGIGPRLAKEEEAYIEDAESRGTRNGDGLPRAQLGPNPPLPTPSSTMSTASIAQQSQAWWSRQAHTPRPQHDRKDGSGGGGYFHEKHPPSCLRLGPRTPAVSPCPPTPPEPIARCEPRAFRTFPELTNAPQDSDVLDVAMEDDGERDSSCPNPHRVNSLRDAPLDQSRDCFEDALPADEDINASESCGNDPSSMTGTQTRPQGRIQRVFLTLRDSLQTAFNAMGLCRQYPRRPSFEPDKFIPSSLLANSSDLPPEPPYPFSNMTTYRLMSWMNSGSLHKSEAEISRLVKDVIQAKDFNPRDLDGFSETDITLNVPTKSTNESRSFNVRGFHYRLLVGVIRSAFADVQANAFHLLPFKRLWKDPLDGHQERVFDELYMSDSWLEAQDDLQRHPKEPGCSLERVIAGLMFFSDAMHLATFGTAKAWPLYLYFGNLTKYARSAPKSGACHLVGFLPSLPDAIKDVLSNLPRISKSGMAALQAHCRQGFV